MFATRVSSPAPRSSKRRTTAAHEAVIIELRRSPLLADLAAAGRASQTLADVKSLPRLSGISWDAAYPLVSVHATRVRRAPRIAADISPPVEVDPRLPAQTFFARATADAAGLLALRAAGHNAGQVVGVSIDLPVRFCGQIASARAPASLDAVRHLVGVDVLADHGLDGNQVWVAVIDGGISRTALEACGVTATCDEDRSWTADERARPFGFKRGHGTMCAFDVCVGAPRCVLMDFAAFRAYQPTGGDAPNAPLTAMLSDAVNAYSKLCELLLRESRAGRTRSLVVSNSWEVDGRRDYPPDSPLNYGSNRQHAMNKIVDRLSLLGADIVFSAGNTTAAERESDPRPICGANAHPSVLTVAGVDVESRRLDMSRPGPGTLSTEKPDLAAYSRFQGSGTSGPSTPDDGTSAACALTAGVVAAIRSGFPYDPKRPETSPAALRSILKKQAREIGSQGFDFDHGWGVLDAAAVAEALLAPPANFRPADWHCRPPAVALRPVK